MRAVLDCLKGRCLYVFADYVSLSNVWHKLIDTHTHWPVHTTNTNDYYKGAPDGVVSLAFFAWQLSGPLFGQPVFAPARAGHVQP